MVNITAPTMHNLITLITTVRYNPRIRMNERPVVSLNHKATPRNDSRLRQQRTGAATLRLFEPRHLGFSHSALREHVDFDFIVFIAISHTVSSTRPAQVSILLSFCILSLHIAHHVE
jgi:hypothetical protein